MKRAPIVALTLGLLLGACGDDETTPAGAGGGSTTSAANTTNGSGGSGGSTATTGGAGGQGGNELPVENWTEQDTPGSDLTLTDVHFTTVSHGWAVGEAGNILSTEDSGETWSLAQISELASFTNAAAGVHFVDDTTGCVVSGTRIVQTTNGGTSWSVVLESPGPILNDVFFASPQAGWTVGTDGSIYATSDGGATWTAQVSGLTGPIGLNRLHFVNSMEGWTAGDDGTVLHTTNGGTSWTPQTVPTTEDLRAVHFTDASNGWAGGLSGSFVATTDGGSTWTNVALGTSSTITDIAFASPTHGWLSASFPKAIWATQDGGTTWAMQTAPGGMSGFYFALHFATPTLGWIVGNNSTIIRTTTGN